MVEVVAALIWDEDKFMICQRPAHKARGLMWEFVGGKQEQGETLEEALIRECREELDIVVSPENLFMEVMHEYPDINIHLSVFNAVISSGEIKLLEHNDMKWITPSEIDNYDFCPADEDILKKIKEVFLKNTELYGSQKKLLDTFLKNGNITEIQYNKSLSVLKEKLLTKF